MSWITSISKGILLIVSNGNLPNYGSDKERDPSDNYGFLPNYERGLTKGTDGNKEKIRDMLEIFPRYNQWKIWETLELSSYDLRLS